MNRRKFAFFCGMVCFWMAEQLRADWLDSFAAGWMKWNDAASKIRTNERWKAGENRKWSWYERETNSGGKWTFSGRTLPKNKHTGEYLKSDAGYLNESLVPWHVKVAADRLREKLSSAKVDVSRRAAHGRPPSQWLRSLNSEELSFWLKTIDIPKAFVSGMTVTQHLTRDHSFVAARIEGLSNSELHKLHAAAHYGY